MTKPVGNYGVPFVSKLYLLTDQFFSKNQFGSCWYLLKLDSVFVACLLKIDSVFVHCKINLVFVTNMKTDSVFVALLKIDLVFITHIKPN